MIKLLHVIVMKSDTRDAVCVCLQVALWFSWYSQLYLLLVLEYSLCATAVLSFCNCISFGLLVFFPLKIQFNKILVCVFREPVKTSIASYKISFCSYSFQIVCIADYMPTKPPTVCDVNKSILHRKKQELAEFWLASVATGFYQSAGVVQHCIPS